VPAGFAWFPKNESLQVCKSLPREAESSPLQAKGEKNSLKIIIFLQSGKKTFQEGHRTQKAILTLIDFHEIKYMKPHFLPVAFGLTIL